MYWMDTDCNSKLKEYNVHTSLVGFKNNSFATGTDFVKWFMS